MTISLWEREERRETEKERTIPRIMASTMATSGFVGMRNRKSTIEFTFEGE